MFICRSRWLYSRGGAAFGETPASFTVVGDWQVRIAVEEPRAVSRTVHVSPAKWVEVTGEKYERLPLFNPKAGGWIKAGWWIEAGG